MRIATFSVLSIPVLLSTITSVLSFDCSHIRADREKFNFEKLGGPRSVTHVDKSRPPSVRNSTYTIDICDALKRDKNVDKAAQCPHGTNVCGIEDAYDPVSDTWNHFDSVIPIAGSYGTSTGKGLDATFTRLKKEDTENEGLRMELHGGKYAELDQMAIIEFQCDLEKTGNEGFDSIDDRRRSTNTTESPEDGESGDGDDKDEAKSLQFVSYGLRDDKTKLLRLNWKTKYACEDYEDDDNDGNSSGGSSHWGFFTWFIIILFLGIASYLIFGSWLNYSRYGARGWDLLPHGDTIRDMPYLFKDWGRKVVDTVQGGGSRGGYSAV